MKSIWHVCALAFCLVSARADNRNLLHEAVEANDVAKVKKLLAENYPGEHNGCYAIQKVNSIELMNVFLDANISPNLSNQDFYASCSPTMIGAACFADAALYDRMVKAGGIIDTKSYYRSDKLANSPMLMAASCGNIAILEYLKSQGVKPHRDFQGKTLLMNAAANHHIEAVKYLLENGQRISDREIGGGTALTLVIENESLNNYPEAERTNHMTPDYEQKKSDMIIFLGTATKDKKALNKYLGRMVVTNDLATLRGLVAAGVAINQLSMPQPGEGREIPLCSIEDTRTAVWGLKRAIPFFTFLATLNVRTDFKCDGEPALFRYGRSEVEILEQWLKLKPNLKVKNKEGKTLLKVLQSEYEEQSKIEMTSTFGTEADRRAEQQGIVERLRRKIELVQQAMGGN